MSDNHLLRELHGGKVHDVAVCQHLAAKILTEPGLFGLAFEGLNHGDPLVRMRSAYIVHEIAKHKPEMVQPYKDELIERMTQPDNSHLAQGCMVRTLPLLELEAGDMEMVVGLYQDFLHSESSIVKAHALEYLAQLAEEDLELRGRIMPLIVQACDWGTPAMRVKARRALRRFGFAQN